MPHNLERDEVPPCGKSHEFRQSNKCDRPSQALIHLDRCTRPPICCSGDAPRTLDPAAAARRLTETDLFIAGRLPHTTEPAPESTGPGSGGQPPGIILLSTALRFFAAVQRVHVHVDEVRATFLFVGRVFEALHVCTRRPLRFAACDE